VSPLTPARRLLRLAGLAALGAVAGSLLASGVASADLLTPESGGSPNADRIDTLYKLILYIAIVVFIGVEGALIWSLVRFRARKGRVAAQIHGNTRLEIGWTVGAAVLLVFITAVTFVQLGKIKNPEASDPGGLAGARPVYASTDQPPPPGGRALNIRVNGQQYIWRYQYPGADVFAYEEMVVPEDTTVTLDITADDVAHSWWIPELGGKFDALPGYVNKTWFKASEPGLYEGQCAELCGRNHANMLARVRVVPVARYQTWFDRQQADIAAARKAGAEGRRALEQEGGASSTEGGTSSAPGSDQ